jgi:hypothetical protein
MAKVTIILEDIQKDGEAGLRVGATSDPSFPDNEEELTVAQDWALEIVNMIVSNASEVTMKDPEESTTH